jgi:hypothetical protein
LYCTDYDEPARIEYADDRRHDPDVPDRAGHQRIAVYAPRICTGINWIYLPAGVRLLSTLLFAEAGAIGLLLVSWAVCFFYFFPNDPVRSFMGGILASASPYLVYCGMRRYFGLQAALTNLTTAKLMICALAFSIASPLFHHLWFALYEDRTDLLRSFLVMATGDFCGTVTVLYAARFILGLSGPVRS